MIQEQEISSEEILKTLAGVYEVPLENQHLDFNLYAFIHPPLLSYIITFPALLPR